MNVIEWLKAVKKTLKLEFQSKFISENHKFQWKQPEYSFMRLYKCWCKMDMESHGNHQADYPNQNQKQQKKISEMDKEHKVAIIW